MPQLTADTIREFIAGVKCLTFNDSLVVGHYYLTSERSIVRITEFRMITSNAIDTGVEGGISSEVVSEWFIGSDGIRRAASGKIINNEDLIQPNSGYNILEHLGDDSLAQMSEPDIRFMVKAWMFSMELAGKNITMSLSDNPLILA